MERLFMQFTLSGHDDIVNRHVLLNKSKISSVQDMRSRDGKHDFRTVTMVNGEVFHVIETYEAILAWLA